MFSHLHITHQDDEHMNEIFYRKVDECILFC